MWEGPRAILGGEEIIPIFRMKGRGVNQGGRAHRGAQGEVRKPGPVIVAKLPRGPFRGGPGIGVEESEGREARDGIVVIPSHDRGVPFPNQTDAGTWIRPVPHQVAEAEDPSHPPLGHVVKDRDERLGVSVDVGEEGAPYGFTISFWTRSRIPLRKRVDSSVEYFLAISRASLMTTLGGISGSQSNS